MGITYTIDVLRLVPYADLDIGVVHIGGAVLQPQTLLAMQLGVGAAWFVNRRGPPAWRSATCSSRRTCCPIR